MGPVRNCGASLALLLVIALALLPGCQSAAPAPTAAPAAVATAAPAPAAPTAAPAPPKPTAAPAAAAPTAAPQKQELKLKVGYGAIPPTIDMLSTVLAQYKGFYEKEGLNVTMLTFIGDSTAARALAAGEIEVFEVFPSVVLPQIEQGAKFKVIQTITPGVDYQLVSAKKITGIKDMEKAIIGISAPGAGSQLIVKGVMSKHGLNPDKPQWIAVGNDASRQQALEAGKIDLTALHAPRALALTRTKPNDFHAIATVSKEIQETVGLSAITTDAVIQQKAEALNRFARAMLLANRWIVANPKEAGDLAMQFIPGIEKEDMDASLKALLDAGTFFGQEGTFDTKAMEAQMKQLVEGKTMKGMLPMDKVIDRQFADLALKELGPFKR